MNELAAQPEDNGKRVAAMQGLRAGQAWLIVLIIAGAALCLGVVIWNLFVQGPFLWHMRQPSFSQGGIEALLLVVAMGTAQALRHRGWRLAVSLVLAELYLRRHAVDLIVLADLLYLELAFALGACVTRLAGAPQPQNITDYLRAFVLGFCAWSVCAWGISALGFGSVAELRWLTILLLAPALWVRAKPWSLFVAQRVDAMPAAARIGMGLIIGWFLILFAHSSTALGYDSQWYGLRGDRILVGAGSIFTSQGLVSPVYYFPKVYELFLIPLSGLGSSSSISGITILMLGLITATIYELLRRVGIGNLGPRLLGVALVISVPALANPALEAKPDMLAAFVLMFAWLNAADFLATRDRAKLIWFLALVFFAAQIKLTAIPYAAASLIATLLAALRLRAFAPSDKTHPAKLAWIAAGLMLIVSAFALARTLLLAGVPTVGPDPLYKLWRAIGFSFSFPVGMLRWSFPKDWANTPVLLLDLLFRPQNLERLQIAWTGNVFLWLAAIALCARTVMRLPEDSAASSSRLSIFRDAACRPALALAFIAFLLMLCWGYDVRGGDGNYFMTGIAAAIVLGFGAVWGRVAHSRASRGVLLACIGAFCFFQASYATLSAGWRSGTREWDLDFSRSVRTFGHESRKLFAERGIAQIATHLSHLEHNARVIGCTEFVNTLGFRLQASYEDVGQVSFAHADFTDTDSHFIDFLKADRIEYLIVPRADTNDLDCKGGHVIIPVAAQFDEDPAIPKIRDDKYLLYDVSGLWRK